jgi:branched-chain amino acid transport system substrate-binding protein
VGEQVLPAQGRAALGVYNTLHWSGDINTVQNRTFVTRYRSLAGREPDGYAVHGYWTARSIVEAVRAVQGDTSDMQRVIRAFEGVQFEGPGGRVRMDPKTHQIVSKIYVRQVRDVGNALTNVTLEDLGEAIDPGDNSKGPVPR